MRKRLFTAVVLGGVPLLLSGCMGKASAPTAMGQVAKPTGLAAVAALFKSDKPKVKSAETIHPSDPTSLAHKGKPLGSDLYVASARLSEKNGNIAVAEGQYQRALKMTPDDLPALLGYAHLLDRQGRFEEATTYYLRAAEKHPGEAGVHNDLGLCYARRGMLNESLVELSKAVELQPQKQLYRNNIATVFIEAGKTNEALEHLMFNDPPGVAHYNLACLLHQRGQTQPAAFHFAEAARHDPSLGAAREWAEKIGGARSGPRLTNVRPVAMPNAPSQQGAPAASMPLQGGSAVFNAQGQPPFQGASAQHQSWPPANTPAASQPSASRDWSQGAIAPGWGQAAIPPTPETAARYTAQRDQTDSLPPIDTQPVPRY